MNPASQNLDSFVSGFRFNLCGKRCRGDLRDAAVAVRRFEECAGVLAEARGLAERLKRLRDGSLGVGRFGESSVLQHAQVPLCDSDRCAQIVQKNLEHSLGVRHAVLRRHAPLATLGSMSERPVPHYTAANRPSILIVDDYDDARDVWTTLLGMEGFDVLTAANGVDALAIALTGAPNLVVLDLSLPDMSGVEVARAIRDQQSGRAMPLVALTGFSDPEHLAQARDAGFDLVLTKPCTPSVLIDEIRRLLGERVA